MLRPNREGAKEWRLLKSKELHSKYSLLNVSIVINSGRISWAGNAERMGNIRNAYFELGKVSPRVLRYSIVNQPSTNGTYSTVTRGWHNQHTWVQSTKGLGINPQPQLASLLCDSDIIVKQAALPWDSFLHHRHNKPHYRGTQSYTIATTSRITAWLSPTSSPQQTTLPRDSVLHHRHNRPHYQTIPHITAECRTHTYSFGRKKVK